MHWLHQLWRWCGCFTTSDQAACLGLSWPFPSRRSSPKTDWYQLDHQRLPHSMLFGIPPAMHTTLIGTYWGTPPGDMPPEATSNRAALGIVEGRDQASRSTLGLHNAIQQHLDDQTLPTHQARQASSHLRGPYQPPADITPPPPCHDAPPEQPNVYTDGTLTHPTQPEFNLGAAAVWHPNRRMDEQQVSETEAQSAVFSQLAQGLQAYTSLPGHTTSSTRAELIAGILALGRQGPVHMATDSQSFMNKALWVLAIIQADQSPKRPWPFHIDGDLWAMYHAHAKSKTPQAIRISKVKGHATDEMVASGCATKTDQDGNHQADLAADEGIELFTSMVVQSSAAWAQRHSDYTAWIKQLWQHITFTYRVREALLKHQAQPTNPPPQSNQQTSHTPTQAIAMPDDEPTNVHDTPHHFHFTTHITNYPNTVTQHPAAKAIQAFVATMPVHKIGLSSSRGITWFELLILYRMLGNPLPITSSPGSAAPKTSLRQQLHGFRIAVRRIVTQTMHRSDHKLWVGMHTSQHRLRKLGITTHLATLPWQPCLTQQAKANLAIEIIRSQYGKTRIQATQALHDHTPLPFKRAQMKGRARWMDSIQLTPHPYPPSLTQHQPHHDASTQHHSTISHTGASSSSQQARQSSSSSVGPLSLATPSGGADADADRHDDHSLLAATNGDDQTTQGIPPPPPQPLPQAVFFQCPKCPHMLPAANRNFATNQLDRKVWCNPCRRSIPTTRWQCSCGLQWHVCPQHKFEPQRLRASMPTQCHHPQPKAKPAPRAKALGKGQDQRLHQWLDQPPPKRARPPPAEIELGALPPQQAGVKHYLLSPGLRAKFPRLQAPASNSSQAPELGTYSPDDPTPTPT